MVRTRSNLDTADPGPLPVDANDVNVLDKARNRSRIAWDYFAKISLQWPKPHLTSFLLSKPDFEDGAETEWLPVRPLGSAPSMVVALWKKLDQDGDAIDHVVIKDSRVRARENMYSVGLSNEAVYQGHLTAMKLSRHNITQLRGYKFYPVQQGSAEWDRARLYMRYAPHGTLQDVWYRYRAFRTYLPELYLWSVLVDLATAYQLLGKCPETWNPIPRGGRIPHEMDRDPNAFIAHQDIKPVNCFVGTDVSKAIRRSAYYPTELGDFGVSDVRTPESYSKSFFGSGTQGYFAPEQTGYGEKWRQKIYNFTPTQFRVRKSTNAWGIGQTLFHLMTLKTVDQFPGILFERHRLHKNDPPNEDDALYEQAYYTFGRHFMRRSAMDCDHPAGQYSEALRDLVYQCLRPDMDQRPDAAELLRRAETGYQTWWRKSRKDGVPPVHFSNIAMNDHVQPPGDSAIVFSLDDPNDNSIFRGYITGNDFLDPEDSLLKPRAEWSNFAIGAPGPPRYAEPEQYLDEYPPPPNAYKGSAYREVLDGLRDGRLLGRKDVDVMPGPRPALKRARSWDSQDEHDLDMRQLLQDLRNRTRVYASGKSMRLLTHILEREKYDVVAAEKVLQWIYQARSGIRFGWAQHQRTQQQAAVVLRKWQKRFGQSRPRNLRECFYFVSNESPGPLRIDFTIRTMEHIFQPEDAESSDEDDKGEDGGDDVDNGDKNDESRDQHPAEPVLPVPGSLTKVQLQRYREAQIALIDLHERGLARDWGMEEAGLIRRLHQLNWDVQAVVDHVSQAEEDWRNELATRIRQAHEEEIQIPILRALVARRDDQRAAERAVARARGEDTEIGPAGRGREKYPEVKVESLSQQNRPRGSFDGIGRYVLDDGAGGPPDPQGGADGGSEGGGQACPSVHGRHAIARSDGGAGAHNPVVVTDGFGADGAGADAGGAKAAAGASGRQQDDAEGTTGKGKKRNKEVDQYWTMQKQLLEEENESRQWRLDKELDAKHQQRYRAEHREKINKKLTGQRRYSLDRFAGDRWDPDFGEIKINELRGKPAVEMYLSGAVGSGDVPGIHEDREHRRQVRREIRENHKWERRERRERVLEEMRQLEALLRAPDNVDEGGEEGEQYDDDDDEQEQE